MTQLSYCRDRDTLLLLRCCRPASTASQGATLFFERTAQDSAYFIDIEGKDKKLQKEAGKSASDSEGYHSRASRPAKSLAPAAIQSETSSLILFTKEGTEAPRRSKMRLFLSFQISRLTSSVKERKPLRGVSGTVVICNHQSFGEALCNHRVGGGKWGPIHVASRDQILSV
jgi:hypothetical protein